MTHALHAASGADWQRNLVEDDAGLKAVLEGVRLVAVVGIKDERRTYEPAHYIARYLQEVGYEVAGVNPGINQTLGHFRYRMAKCLVGQFGLAHPAAEVPSFEYTPHVLNMPLSGIFCLLQNYLHGRAAEPCYRGTAAPCTGRIGLPLSLIHI